MVTVPAVPATVRSGDANVPSSEEQLSLLFRLPIPVPIKPPSPPLLLPLTCRLLPSNSLGASEAPPPPPPLRPPKYAEEVDLGLERRRGSAPKTRLLCPGTSPPPPPLPRLMR